MPKREKLQPQRIAEEQLADFQNILTCTACPLGGKGQGVPPDSRMRGADILVVGEGPGRDEVPVRIPMVGQSGTLARRMLRRGGALHRVHILNTVNCRPPNNRDPEELEILTCKQWVDSYVATMRPKAIITMGKYSTKWVAGRKGGIGQNHGKITQRDGILYLSLYHPAYLFRKRGTQAYRELEASYIHAIEELVDRVDNPRELPQYTPVVIANLPPDGDYYVDTEYYGGNDPRTVTPILASVSDGEWSAVTWDMDFSEWRGTPTAHHIMQDLPVLMRHGLKRPSRAGCTMTMAHLAGERQLGLKHLSRKLLNTIVMEYEEMLVTQGWAPKMNYAAQDAVLAARLEPVLRPRLASAEWVYDNIIMPLAPILAESTLRGMAVDQSRLQPLLQSETRKLEIATAELRKYTDGTFNPNSTDQKIAAVKDIVGRRVPNAQRDTLQRLHAKTKHPFLRALVAYSVAKKATSTYLNKMATMDTISCEWDLTGTETGRLSSSNPNLQNLPHRISRCIMAREGYIFVVADYSQLELRILAYLSRDANMIDAYVNKKDLHAELAMKVYGVVTEVLRTRAKSANFEIPYGGGAAKLAVILGCSLLEAQQIHRGHRRVHPDAHRWFERVIAESFENGYSETILGRRRYLWDRDSDDPYLRDKAQRQAINTPIQGSGGDFTELAMATCAAPIEQLGGWIPHQIHDSIIAEVPIGTEIEAGEILDTHMLAAVPDYVQAVVPFKVDVQVRSHIYD